MEPGHCLPRFPVLTGGNRKVGSHSPNLHERSCRERFFCPYGRWTRLDLRRHGSYQFRPRRAFHGWGIYSLVSLFEVGLALLFGRGWRARCCYADRLAHGTDLVPAHAR